MGCCGGYRRAHKQTSVSFKTLMGKKDRKTCKFCYGALVQKVVWKNGEKVVIYTCSMCGRPGV